MRSTLRFIVFISVLSLIYSCKFDKIKKTSTKTKYASTRDFGFTEQGDTVYLYTLKNHNDVKVSILNYGGIIQAIETPDIEGGFTDISLGYDKLDGYLENDPHFGAIIGRYGNRIANSAFTLNDSTYHLHQNNGPNSLHGGKEGFDKKIWDAETFNKDSLGVQMHYRSEDGEEGYPGNLNVTVTYTLNEDNELQINYKAETDKPTVLNLTNHSYFNLRGGKDAINDYVLTLDADEYLPVDSTLIPTGKSSVSDTPMDFRKPMEIGKHINDDDQQLNLAGGGYDFSWVLNQADNIKQQAAKVCDPKTGRSIEVYTTEPAIQVYTSNSLDEPNGKNETAYSKHSAIALETQHFPDAPNQPDFPSTVLNPDEIFKSTTIYKFGVEENCTE